MLTVCCKDEYKKLSVSIEIQTAVPSSFLTFFHFPFSIDYLIAPFLVLPIIYQKSFLAKTKKFKNSIKKQIWWSFQIIAAIEDDYDCQPNCNTSEYKDAQADVQETTDLKTPILSPSYQREVSIVTIWIPNNKGRQ